MNQIVEDFKNEIEKLVVEKFLKEEKNKESGSFIEILPFVSSQSLVIKLGTIFEKGYNFIVEKYADNFLIKKMVESETNRQLDLLFKHKDVIYYFETKLNLNLDTEKTKETMVKIAEIEDLLYSIFGVDKIVVSKVFGSRYGKSEDFAKTTKFSKNSVIGYNDFFSIFDKNCNINNNDWENFIFKIGEKILHLKNETTN
jgi:hypothetical protein